MTDPEARCAQPGCGHYQSCACHTVESGGDPYSEIAVWGFQRHRFIHQGERLEDFIPSKEGP